MPIHEGSHARATAAAAGARAAPAACRLPRGRGRPRPPASPKRSTLLPQLTPVQCCSASAGALTEISATFTVIGPEGWKHGGDVGDPLCFRTALTPVIDTASTGDAAKPLSATPVYAKRDSPAGSADPDAITAAPGKPCTRLRCSRQFCCAQTAPLPPAGRLLRARLLRLPALLSRTAARC